MANTFKKIQTVTVGSGGAANIEFTSIPQTYTDLKIVYSLRSNDTNANGGNFFYFQFNNTGFTGLTGRVIGGNGSTTNSGTGSLYAFMNPSDFTASTFSNGEFYMPNYTSANNKSYSVESVNENNATAANVNLGAGLWSNSAAVTSVKFAPYSGSFVQYSTATLYGIYDEVKATGGAITADANFIYHTFTSDGTFTPLQSLNVDYLVVAGGGGGGLDFFSAGRGAGGGGAGGVRCTVGATGGGGSLESRLAVTAQAYTVTVGAGGGAGGGANGNGFNGSNSVFSSITSTGGGGGGGHNASTSADGNNGGSGGGASNGKIGGTGTANQGYAGGSDTSSSPYNGGGGGGAGAVGGAGSNSGTGNGGNGVTTSISGTSTTYGGGGGSRGTSGNGTGGTGGGGNGGGLGNGTANTGGGGGASRTGLNAGTGGSGIVIVRYAR